MGSGSIPSANARNIHRLLSLTKGCRLARPPEGRGPDFRERETCQLACKPGSVWPRSPGAWQPFIWDGARAPPRATHPDDEAGNSPGAFARMSSLFGLAPGGVCHAVPVARSAVGSYPTFSPSLRQRRPPCRWPGVCSETGGAVCFLWHFPWGRPRRTLSGAVFPWSPDFPHPAAFRPLRSAAARPTGSAHVGDDGGD